MTATTIVTIRYTATVPASSINLAISDTQTFNFDNDRDALRFCASIADDETLKVVEYRAIHTSSLAANTAALAMFKDSLNRSF